MIESINKIKLLLTRQQKLSLVYLSLLLVIGMFLEIFGLGLIIPLITIILDPELINDTYGIRQIKEYLGDINNNEFLYYSLITIILVYVIKTLFLIFLAFKQNTFLSNLYAQLSIKLFNHYLNQDYSFHLKKNSSLLIKNIQVEVNLFRSYCTSLVSLFIEFALLISIIATLVYIEPFGAVIVGVFFTFFSLLVIEFSKKSLKFWGKKREKLDQSISKNILEGFGGIKEILILGRKKFFNNIFSNNNFLRANILRNYLTTSQIPRYLLEIIAVFGIVGFIFLMIQQDKDVNELLTILGVFVAATFRMIPSFNRIISALQNMKYYSSSIDLLYDEFKSNKKYENKIDKCFNEIKFNKKIEIKNLCFKYEQENDYILENSNLIINKGDCIGIIGISGSGKSTLASLITGLFRPERGSIIVDGVNIGTNIRSWQKKIGYVPQSIYLTDDSIVNNIALGVSAEKINYDSINRSIDAAQLTDLINSLDEGLNTNVGERGVKLSGGQMQRVGIARALYNDPELLILDEATASLDSITESHFMEAVGFLKGSKTLIIISHKMSTLKDCNQIFNIQDKMIKQNKIKV
tara:strand:+ start:669 stop:2405 length:1737 start_codon:yes stop_codon:yes gene_type:complete